MDLLGRDPDLGAKAKFIAIGKARGGIGIDDSCVHSVHEALDRLRIIAEDRVRMHRMVRIDVVDGFLQRIDTVNGDLIIKVLFAIIRLSGRNEAVIHGANGLIRMDLHAVFLQRGKQAGHQIEPLPMDEQALTGIADTDALTFGVDDHRDHLIRVHSAVHIDDAVAAAGLDERHSGVLYSVRCL